jgi:hypothetical protein
MFRDERVKRFVDGLRRESVFFSEAWEEQSVQYRKGGLRSFRHSQQEFFFEQHSYTPSEAPSYKLVFLLPIS